MILLARTTPLADVVKKSEGMSIIMVDLRQAERSGMTVRPIANMVNHETNELFFENLEIPAENLIGLEGQGFRYILDGLNACSHAVMDNGIHAAGFLGGTLQGAGDRGEVVVRFSLLLGPAHGWRWIRIGVAPEFSNMAHLSASGL